MGFQRRAVDVPRRGPAQHVSGESHPHSRKTKLWPTCPANLEAKAMIPGLGQLATPPRPAPSSSVFLGPREQDAAGSRRRRGPAVQRVSRQREQDRIAAFHPGSRLGVMAPCSSFNQTTYLGEIQRGKLNLDRLHLVTDPRCRERRSGDDPFGRRRCHGQFHRGCKPPSAERPGRWSNKTISSSVASGTPTPTPFAWVLRGPGQPDLGFARGDESPRARRPTELASARLTDTEVGRYAVPVVCLRTYHP